MFYFGKWVKEAKDDLVCQRGVRKGFEIKQNIWIKAAMQLKTKWKIHVLYLIGKKNLK